MVEDVSLSTEEESAGSLSVKEGGVGSLCAKYGEGAGHSKP